MKGMRPLLDQEVNLVLSGFTGPYANRDKALFLVGIKSGFRISELLSLQIKDVLQAGHIVDRVTIDRKYMKKKTEGRTVILHPEAKKAIETWINEFKEEPNFSPESYIFQSRKSKNHPICRGQGWRILEKAYKSNGITGKLGTHSMRKTFANKVYEKLNGDLVKTQKALGHRDINSTVSYLSFKEEDIDQAILAI